MTEQLPLDEIALFNADNACDNARDGLNEKSTVREHAAVASAEAMLSIAYNLNALLHLLNGRGNPSDPAAEPSPLSPLHSIAFSLRSLSTAAMIEHGLD